jgi:undecaprenyl-diphosphatase
MEWYKAILLGIVQGLTEFLPISSSGHLALLEHFFGIQEAGLGFDIILHVGTLVALVIFFWKDWMGMFQAVIWRERYNRFERRLFGYLVLATIPGGVIGYLLEHKAETVFRTPTRIAVLMGSVGLLLYLAEKTARHQRRLTGMKLRDALIIGCSQALAVMPGVSRSGITMTTGLFLGLTRETAARFSFLLSTPIICGAGVHHILKLFKGEADHFHFWPYTLGFLAAVISSYLTIKFLLSFLQRHTFNIFVVYRLVAAGVVLVLVYLGVGPK